MMGRKMFFYKMKFVTLSILLLSGILAGALHAQGVIIGRVTDSKTQEGLPGVNVQIEKTVLGAGTNLKGAFLIRRVPFGVYSLRISMIGYQRKRVANVKVSVGDTALVLVALKEAPIEIDPVVVTASKWQQEAASTSATIEVLTAKQIMTRNPIRIEDVLETAAGVQVLQDNVSIRGSDGYTFGVGSKVLVMLDGIPIMNSDFGKVNWFMISPPDIERAEIVRGAGSALYGSSAMGGVMNFITRSPQPKSRTFIRAMFGVYDDSHEPAWNWAAREDKVQTFNRQDFTHSRQIGNLGLRISGGRSFSEGYVENGNYERYNISGKMIYRFPNASRLTLYGNYMNDQSGIFTIWKSQKEALNVPPSERDKEQDQDGVTLFGKYSWPFSSKASVDVNVYYNRFLLGTQGTTEGTFSPALGLGGTVQGRYLPFSWLSIVYGSDFKFDQIKSSPELYGERDAILAAPYFQIDGKLRHNLNLTLGGRYDRYEIYSDPDAVLGQARDYDHFSPKVGLNYHPAENTTIRGSVANGFKFPVVAQLFLAFDGPGFTFRPNPDLRSETSLTYEIGVRQKLTPTWFVEVNGFLTNVDDLIELDVNAFTREVKFINIEDVRIPGIELVTNGRWFDNHLGLKANLLWMNPEDRIRNELLPYRQKFLLFLAPSLRFGDVEFQVDYKYASTQDRYSLSGSNQLVPQKVLDARIFFYWQQHSFFIGVNNASNYAYTVRDQSIEEIRNFVTGVSLEF